MNPIKSKKVNDFYEALLRDLIRPDEAAFRQDRIRIQVGSATCELAAGAGEVLDELKKHIAASERDDIVVREVGCTGRCSREPLLGVVIPGRMPVTYEKADRELVHRVFIEHVQGGRPLYENMLDGPGRQISRREVLFCRSRRCLRPDGAGWERDFRDMLDRSGISREEIDILSASCFGACRGEAATDASTILVRPDKVLYRIRNRSDLEEIIESHLRRGEVVERLRWKLPPLNRSFFDLYGDVAFFNRQSRVSLRNSGVLDPESLAEYVNFRGFRALAVALGGGDPLWVIDQVSRARLRGRGGAGYPTGQKWIDTREPAAENRYIVCNADEGDPGAFMNRSMLESDPFNIVEGMIIGGFAIGAKKGFFYIRAEYPLAIARIQKAIDICREKRLLGKNIMDSGFDFEIEIRLGAGAFVCGEETALIHSIEGERGQPRIRPPYPSERGLWGEPTAINNVETLAGVTGIINYGCDWFRSLGTDKSGGTKVFALAGTIRHTGLVEVPLGTTLKEIVFEIGGGMPEGSEFKAVQTGGPAGGCLPLELIDLPVDYDSLNRAGTIMGSGGMIVLGQNDCMVDIAKYYLSFSQDESCGKCSPCREGTTRMLEILEKISAGRGTRREIENLERLAKLVKKSSLCGLGRAAPNPVLSTLTHFRDEYLAHVDDKRCPAGRCTGLLRYSVDPESCVGCGLCARDCPAACISGEKRRPHEIDQERCIKCGRCLEVCRFQAVKVS